MNSAQQAARARILARVRKVTCEREPDFATVQAQRPATERDLTRIPDLTREFYKRAEANGAELFELSSLPALPEILRVNVPYKGRLAFDDVFSDVEWAHPIDADYRTDAETGVIQARWAIAETGTLVFDCRTVASGLLFLVDNLVAVLRLSRLVGRQEEVWAHTGKPASAVHLVSGPSRTADVEQTIQIGAHGPRRLLIALLDDRNTRATQPDGATFRAER